MSVIQTIRDRGGLISAIIIAIALLGFILMDAFSSRSNIFGGNTNTLGSVNGKAIQYLEYEKVVKQQEAAYAQQGVPVDDRTRQQIGQSVWNAEIEKVVLGEEFDKLGISVGRTELNDIMFGKNPPADLKQNFVDKQTGLYDPIAARQYILDAGRRGTPDQRKQMDAYITSLEQNRMQEKFMSLLTVSAAAPKWFVEKQNIDNSQQAAVSFVKIPYTVIPDSAAKVSDEEISAYINKHKSEYKQTEETRTVEYVIFNGAPNAADSNDVRTKLEAIKPEFAAATDMDAFVVKAGSELPFYDGYLKKDMIQQQGNKDSILGQPVGVVYGPYLDAGSYGLSKVLGVKEWPDTVKVRHILVATQIRNPQNPQQMVPIREDSVARKRMDTVEALIRSGVGFDSLAVKFSDDQSNSSTGGVIDNMVNNGQWAPEFSEFVFDNKTGKTGVVKTVFGYHFIEILNQKGLGPVYKVAYVTKPIYASSTTDDSVSNAASKFASDSRDTKGFDANFEKELRAKGLSKQVAADIKPNDYSLSQFMEPSRQLVKAIFDSKTGAVLQPYRVGDNYIVVTITDINKPGTQSINKVRPAIEMILSRQKKAQLISQKLGKITTLDAAAAVYSQPVLTDSSLRLTSVGSLIGAEPRIAGAAFNPANKGKVVEEALAGREGVFVIRVDNVTATAVENANIEEQRKQQAMNLRQRLGNPKDILIKAADVKDERSKIL